MNMNNIIRIENADIPVINHRDQRVITLPLIDKVHSRLGGTAGRSFRENRPRFIENEDFFELNQPDEIRRLGLTRPQGGTPEKVILMTESGYLMLVKSFSDDLAWQVQRQLVKTYFRAKTNHATVPMELLNDPATMRGLLLGYTEKVLALQAENAVIKPKADALDRISAGEGSRCPTDAAKALKVPPKRFFAFLREHRWIYRRPGGKNWLAYQDRIQAGLLEHKITTIELTDGSAKVVEQVFVTPKGITKLASLIAESMVA